MRAWERVARARVAAASRSYIDSESSPITTNSRAGKGAGRVAAFGGEGSCGGEAGDATKMICGSGGAEGGVSFLRVKNHIAINMAGMLAATPTTTPSKTAIASLLMRRPMMMASVMPKAVRATRKTRRRRKKKVHHRDTENAEKNLCDLRASVVTSL